MVTQPSTISGRDGGGSASVCGVSVWTSGDAVLTDPVDSVGAPRSFMEPTTFEADFNTTHPELGEQDGKIQFVTWSRATTGWFGREFVILRVELE